ncbi:hypothetical protein N9K07_01630 [Arenitalea sp.]|nr:hypothetical protein [Algibacter sp.]MDA9069437.1 hypothetical protein [Algibacter sp.]
MTLYEFNALELNERMEAVNQYGTFLDNHIGNGERCNCYAIDNFFIEVVYDAEHNTLVVHNIQGINAVVNPLFC